MITLQTERLILKPHTLENAEALTRWSNDPEISYYDDEDEPSEHSIGGVQDFIRRRCLAEPPDVLHFAIHKKEGETLIGMIMLGHIDRWNKHCEIGITIGEKSEWGQGFGREATAAVLGYAFESLEMHRVSALVFAFNERSIRLFEGLGFTREGVLRENVFKRDRFEDEIAYSMLREEWKERQVAEQKAKVASETG